MAEEQDDSQEKTEEATPKRLDEAREKGQVSRSRELSTMAVLVIGSASLFLLGKNIINSLLGIMHDGFIIERNNLFNNEFITISLLKASTDAVQGLTPLMLTLFFVALLAPMGVGGWNFSIQAMAFKWEKLDPIKGMKRVFGVRGLMELAKALAKFTLIGGLSVLFLWTQVEQLLYLGHNGLLPGLVEASEIIVWALVVFSASTILIAAVDVPFQLWEHSRQLKMSKQEVKDEMKETEGKPELKAHIKEMQQQLANRRMLEEVPKADVIITNPTHYAVALSYDQEKMGAPRVVAKGVDFMAQQIRLVAGQHEVTVFTAPLLARAIYYNTKINQEIPAGLYLAVAQILAYVYQLKASRKDPNIDTPAKPEQVPIPDEYKKY